MTMSIQQLTPIHVTRYPEAERLNPRLVTAWSALADTDFERRTHFISGRFENLYPSRDQLPGVEQLLAFAEHQARAILGLTRQALRCGFWLNAMAPGDRTSEHTHDEDDELLSGVYYITAPEGSGDILFHDDPFEVRVAPEPGMMLLFPPRVAHSVETNRSLEQRLSLAFNIGPAAA